AEQTQCMPGGSGLLPFTNAVTIDTSGTKNLTAITWPTSAEQAGTAYYVCALTNTSPPVAVLSTQSFTVAQDVTVSLSSTTIQPGQSIIITGTNWLPVQKLLVQIAASGASDVLVSSEPTPDSAGNFSTTLTIPSNAPSGTYAVTVSAPKEQTQAMSPTPV